jgi:hypothetical protein
MRTRTGLAALGIIFATSGVAAAQEAQEIYEENTGPMFGRGLAVFGGIGVETFSSPTVNGTTGSGTTWEVRGVMGTRSRFGLEAAYVGSAADVDAQLGTSDGTLVGTTLEVVGRAHLVEDRALRPYGFLGLGWRHYQVAGADFETSATGLDDSDSLLTMPIGVGLSYRFDDLGLPDLVGDVRGGFRLNMGPDLVVLDPRDRDSEYAGMHTWDLSVRAGYSF